MGGCCGIRDLPPPEPPGTNELVQHIGQRHGRQTSPTGTGVDRGRRRHPGCGLAGGSGLGQEPGSALVTVLAQQKL